MWSVELNNYPHRGEDNDVRHDPGQRCPVMDGTNNLITGWETGQVCTPYKCEEEACCYSRGDD